MLRLNIVGYNAPSKNGKVQNLFCLQTMTQDLINEINGERISTIIDSWAITIDYSGKAFCQFYILCLTKEEFYQQYRFFAKHLGLRDWGEMKLNLKSFSLVPQIIEKLNDLPDNCAISPKGMASAITVTNFGESYHALHDYTQENELTIYSRARFGHDYNQELAESSRLKELFKEKKLVIFTWVDCNDKDLVMTACSSQFKDGMCQPKSEV